jgi:hypothetical protein
VSNRDRVAAAACSIRAASDVAAASPVAVAYVSSESTDCNWAFRTGFALKE